MNKREEFQKNLKEQVKDKIQQDTFMPHVDRIIVDHPIHPERNMEERELAEKYDKIFEEYLDEK